MWPEGLSATTTAGTVGVGTTLFCGGDNTEYSPASTSIVPTAMLTSAPAPITAACLLVATIPERGSPWCARERFWCGPALGAPDGSTLARRFEGKHSEVVFPAEEGGNRNAVAGDAGPGSDHDRGSDALGRAGEDPTLRVPVWVLEAPGVSRSRSASVAPLGSSVQAAPAYASCTTDAGW